MPTRIEVRIYGIVQGVGFRPFVYRLAQDLSLGGWIYNDAQGVLIEVEGDHKAVLEFLRRVVRDKPAPALIYALEHRYIEPMGEHTFVIQPSPEGSKTPRVWILPDLAVCSDCVREMYNPTDRRYRYPFINCTHCGPRLTIIEDLPYDRPRTSMREFEMCEDCAREYEDPGDRRFHAQPTACPICGPSLTWYAPGLPSVYGEKALQAAVEAIRQGRIIALKGLGGYHLVVDALNNDAVLEIRRRKQRPWKPFAVMYPSLEMARRHAYIDEFSASLLESPQAPIVLLRWTPEGRSVIAPAVAPGSPYLGIFLPYTPLHRLLIDDLNGPIVATSGNFTDEPILHRDHEAQERLVGLCDGFLTHNRRIVRHADDSVIMVLDRPRPRMLMLRRARGYAPLPILAPRSMPPVLALGGHKHVVIALSRDKEIIPSQHLGDMETPEGRRACRTAVEDFLRLYDISPKIVVHDLHSEYFTTHYAKELGLPRIEVQHHHAHMAACMLENRLEGKVLGLTWDGTGYGEDGTSWGGEFLHGDALTVKRIGSLIPFPLPGGDQAVREPWRTAIALLHMCYGREFPQDLPLFQEIPDKRVKITLQMLERNFNCPRSTGMGRLFDGIAALMGLSYVNTHQAQAPQMLEYAAWKHGTIRPPKTPNIPIVEDEILRLDWRPLVREFVQGIRRKEPVPVLAASFHHALVDAALAVIRRVGEPRIVLSGGVFCNRYLLEILWTKIEENGFLGYTHSQIPPTDGGLAVGQLWVAVHHL